MTTRLPAGAIAEMSASPSWEGDGVRAASIVVATHQRSAYVSELLDALTAQTRDDIEIIIVDDASTDDTWTILRESLGRSTRPVLGIRLAEGAGPSRARNVGADHGRGSWLAFTDDDCVPRPDWVAALLDAVVPGAAVVQGRTVAPGGERPGPWDRTIVVTGPSPLYETCNLAVRREEFLAAGGFPDLGLLAGPGSRGFGEDAALGAVLAAAGGRAWAEDAVVEHRWLAGEYADHLAGLRRLAGFPALAAAVPEVSRALWARIFLSRRTAVVDAAVAGVGIAVVGRRWWPLLAALPYARVLYREARERPGAPTAVRMGQLAVGDLTGLAALVRGSLRSGRPVL